jgi:hypothetical protein
MSDGTAMTNLVAVKQAERNPFLLNNNNTIMKKAGSSAATSPQLLWQDVINKDR